MINTIAGLYEWAVENGVEHLPVTLNQSGGFRLYKPQIEGGPEGSFVELYGIKENYTLKDFKE